MKNNSNTTSFQPIENFDLERKNSKIIVTNNINGRNANGQMSHIWIVSSIQKHEDGEFVAFIDNSDRQIFNITHYCELPS